MPTEVIRDAYGTSEMHKISYIKNYHLPILKNGAEKWK